MREDLRYPYPFQTRPLIGGVEAVVPVTTLRGNDLQTGSLQVAAKDSPAARGILIGAQGEDKYEPQRLGRKICWQYDNTARKVPLLRRHYI